MVASKLHFKNKHMNEGLKVFNEPCWCPVPPKGYSNEGYALFIGESLLEIVYGCNLFEGIIYTAKVMPFLSESECERVAGERGLPETRKLYDGREYRNLIQGNRLC